MQQNRLYNIGMMQRNGRCIGRTRKGTIIGPYSLFGLPGKAAYESLCSPLDLLI
jgi:hypothetical protein